MKRHTRKNTLRQKHYPALQPYPFLSTKGRQASIKWTASVQLILPVWKKFYIESAKHQFSKTESSLILNIFSDAKAKLKSTLQGRKHN